ncbi:MAG: hypothetical protein Q7W51_06340 [Coriobacteriia bacterium]|nr:hypothetical protein [Coriobacteriia bacterium]
MSRGFIVCVFALAGTLAVTVGGCGSAAEPAGAPGTPAVEEPVATHDPLPEAERVVGVTELDGGRVRVVGLLQYRADLDGAWLILEGTPGEDPSPDATVIAWIENMYDLDSACSTKGALVYAEGTLAESDGSGPGPALTAEFVARADEPQ